VKAGQRSDLQPHGCASERSLATSRPSLLSSRWSPEGPAIDVRVLGSAWSRTLRIIDAVVKALEARGFPVETGHGHKPRTSALVHGVRVEFHVLELQRQVMRPSEFEWSTGPREYRAHEPTGRLKLVIDEYADGVRKTWKDGKRSSWKTV
jgi:hypothetical protein